MGGENKILFIRKGRVSKMQYYVIRKASEILVIKLTNKKEISASFKFSINKSAKKKTNKLIFKTSSPFCTVLGLALSQSEIFLTAKGAAF